jgi:hypothetical protein
MISISSQWPCGPVLPSQPAPLRIPCWPIWPSALIIPTQNVYFKPPAQACADETQSAYRYPAFGCSFKPAASLHPHRNKCKGTHESRSSQFQAASKGSSRPHQDHRQLVKANPYRLAISSHCTTGIPSPKPARLLICFKPPDDIAMPTSIPPHLQPAASASRIVQRPFEALATTAPANVPPLICKLFQAHRLVQTRATSV